MDHGCFSGCLWPGPYHFWKSQDPHPAPRPRLEAEMGYLSLANSKAISVASCAQKPQAFKTDGA